MSEIVTPLDPDSPKGREVAERLTQVLAEIRLELARAGKPLAPRVRSRRTRTSTPSAERRAAA